MSAKHTAAYRQRHPNKARESNRISAARQRRKHPEKKRQQALAGKKKARERKRELINTAKNNPCMDCGGVFPYFVMDLDHVRGEKICQVSLMVSMGFSDEEIVEEIAKCDLVCAVCHRIRSDKQRTARVA